MKRLLASVAALGLIATPALAASGSAKPADDCPRQPGQEDGKRVGRQDRRQGRFEDRVEEGQVRLLTGMPPGAFPRCRADAGRRWPSHDASEIACASSMPSISGICPSSTTSSNGSPSRAAACIVVRASIAEATVSQLTPGASR